MRRALAGGAAAVLLAGFLSGPSASATTSGGGIQRWAASYDAGAPAFSDAVAVTPDGSTVFVTGSTHLGPTGRWATLAYDASTGAEKWVATFRGSSDPDQWDRGYALAVSPDGSTLFVTGASFCSGCSSSGFNGFSTVAYDISTGTRVWVARYAVDGGASSIAVSPDGSEVFVNGLAAGGDASATVAYEASTGKRSWVIQSTDDPVYSGGALAVSPDSSTVFVAGTTEGSGFSCYRESGGYHVGGYDAADGTERWSAFYQVGSEHFCGTATALALSADGSKLFVTGYGGSGGAAFIYKAAVAAYDASTGTELWATQEDDIRVGAGGTVVDLAVSPDGSKVFVLGYDCAAHPCPRQPFVTIEIGRAHV